MKPDIVDEIDQIASALSHEGFRRLSLMSVALLERQRAKLVSDPTLRMEGRLDAVEETIKEYEKYRKIAFEQSNVQEPA